MRSETATATSQSSLQLSGDLKCRAQLIRIPVDPDHTIWGFDISAEAIEAPGAPAGLSLTGTTARLFMWLGLGAGATGLIISGEKDKDAGKFAGGLGLAFLTFADVVNASVGGPAVLPRLTRLNIRKLGYRFVRFPEIGTQPKKAVHQILLDVGISMSFDGLLSDLITALLGRTIDVAESFANLFAKATSEIEIKGPLELDFANIGFEVTDSGTEVVAEVDERVARIAGQKDFRITAKKFPVIELRPAPTEKPSKIPKPVMGVEFVKNEAAGETKFGVALQIRGIEHPDFAAATPVIGLVIYILPEVDIDFEVSLMVEPTFRFVVPHWVLVEGAFQINKPIPGFDGSQNRISVDVGLIHTEVPKNTKIQKDKMNLLHDLSKYKYQFGGEVAWGEALIDDPAKRFDFFFVQGNYEGPTPIIPLGAVGIYGLGGLAGKNISPGISGEARDATAIAKWIEGSGQDLNAVLDWPTAPSESTWHPESGLDGDSQVAGLKVVAGPMSGRDVVDVEALLAMGFDRFWIAAAGLVKVKSVNLQALAIIVYDHASKTFAIRVRFEFKIESGNTEIVGVAGPFEISTGSHGVSVFLGHYLQGRGGPLVARLLDDLFRAKFFYVYEREGQPAFGFALPGMTKRPDLGRHAFGYGVMFEYGPKRIGPSAIHIRIHAGAGYNLGLSFDPFVLFGEVFLSGSLHVKILFLKVGFTLTAYLSGRLTSEKFVFIGRISFEIGMPWPIPDIEVVFPRFGFTLGDTNGDDVPMPKIASAAFSVFAEESRSEEIAATDVPVLRIDQVIGLRFGKTIAGIMAGDTGVLDLEPQQSPSKRLKETVKTTLAGESFTIEYEHHLLDLRVTHQPVGGGTEVLVDDIYASWEVLPEAGAGSGGQPAEALPRQALYFNGLLQPGLKFMPETLGRLIDVQTVTGTLPPCKRPPRVCLVAGSAPEIDADASSGLRTARRETPYGEIQVSEVRLPPAPSPILIDNRARLAWAGDALRLPGETWAEVPPARKVTLTLVLETAVSRLVGAVEIALDLSIAGRPTPLRLLMSVSPEQTHCGLGLKTDLIGDTAGVTLDAAVRECTQRGRMVIGIEATATSPEIVLQRMRLLGPRVLPPGTGRDADTAQPDPGRWLKVVVELGQRLKLFLRDLCFDTVEQGIGAWETATGGSGPGTTPEGAIDGLLGNLLFQPNRLYTITYALRTSGSTLANAETDEPLDASAVNTETSSVGGDLRTIRFRTEAEPSQDIARYMGFVFPSAGLGPVYPDHTVPVVGFRNQGMIKRIYQAHRGADVLAVKLRDIDGAEVGTVKTASILLSSGASEEVQEALLKECLPQAHGFTRIQVDIFDRALQPDTRYALSVEDTSLPKQPNPPPFRSAFRTSRHKGFVDHVAHANGLLADPVQIPLLGNDPAALLAPVFATAAAGDLSGEDALVEALYRRALGHEPGRLAAEYGPGGDVAAALVACMPDGSLAAFGMALELSEPLLGKDGVSLASTAASLPAALEGKGIARRTVAGSSLLCVSDRSGSRLLVFRSADAAAFQPILSPVALPVAFDGAEAMRDTVAAYVAANFAALAPAEQSQRIAATMCELAAEPALAAGFVQLTGALTLNPVEGA